MISGVEYGRLPAKIASWRSLWAAGLAAVDKSPAFFLYPAAQVAFFAAFLVLAELYFVGAPEEGSETTPVDPDRAGRLRDLKEEAVSLALIFINLIFIHLQTSLILLSRGIGTGINRPYALMLVAVLLVLIPYYHIRRGTVLEKRH